MKSIPKYVFYKAKYGEELLIDVVPLNDIKKYVEQTPVHSLAYYDITLITKGEGIFSIDNQTHFVRPNDIIFSRPGEIRRWDKDKIQEGYALIFEEEFLLSFFNDPHFLQGISFFSPERNFFVMTLDDKSNSRIFSLIENIKAEIVEFRERDKHVLRALLYETLTFLNRAYQQFYSNNINIKIKKEYISQFIALVNENITHTRSIRYYADELCITPNYLNEIVNQSMGVNVKQYLQNKAIIEAKKMLTYTNLSITEIADNLGFDNLSYFIRFFRKQTGYTPMQYRRMEKP